MKAKLAAGVVALAAGIGMAPATVTPPVSIKALIARPHPKGAIRIVYGAAPAQFAELWLPPGPGPHPVVILVHGGCWQAQYGLDLMDWAAEDLRSHGIAVWNIEYRRLGEPGGGYPGTFQDVGQAVDLLRAQAQQYHLKLDPIVAIGHSAGGHLALWAAARGRLPAPSPLKTANPLRIGAVISVGGIGDLENPSDSCNGAATVRELIGEPSATRPQPMADTSPIYLEPFPARQILVQGTLDKVSPPAFGDVYRAKARARGGEAEVTVVQGQAHFDMIAPGATAWDEVIRPLAIGQLRGGRFGGQGAAAKPGRSGPN